METARLGGTAKGGIKRLTLAMTTRQVRDWFKSAAEAIGCTVTVDEVGNMFARRAGRIEGLAPLCMGSHLDTQPTGGKFDGVLGVLGALEAMRTLHESGYETNAPIEIVNWTNEEGSRFAPAMLASGVFAGVFTVDHANGRQDRDGKTFGDELDRIGYRGTEKAGGHSLGAMFELHIEQGPILEDEDKMIGVVTGVQGMRWYEVTVFGQDAHTGATPMYLRKNALLGAARVINAIDAIAHAFAPRCGRDRRPDREQAQQPERDPGRGLLHHRFAPSRRRRARKDGGADARGAGGDPRPVEADLRRDVHLDIPGRSIRAGIDPVRPAGRGKGGIRHARHRVRRRPRRRLYRAGRADHHDLRALPKRHQPQRGRNRPPSSNVPPEHRSCSMRSWSTIAAWRERREQSSPKPKYSIVRTGPM